MKCPFCRCPSSHAGTTTLTFERGGSVVLFRDVPAELCDDCEEPLVADDVAAKVLARAEEAAARGVELEVLRYAA